LRVINKIRRMAGTRFTCQRTGRLFGSEALEQSRNLHGRHARILGVPVCQDPQVIKNKKRKKKKEIYIEEAKDAERRRYRAV